VQGLRTQGHWQLFENFVEVVILFGYAMIFTNVGLFWTLGARIENTSTLEVLRKLQLSLDIQYL
jgi:uncharacterized membrane protein